MVKSKIISVCIRSMEINKIPLGSGDKGKEPSCGGGWKDPANFKKNNDLVKTRKSKMYGVLCGKQNNLLVVDYDIYKLEETAINLKTLKGAHGAGAYIVQTQSGGYHVYHTYEDKFESWKGKCGIYGYIDIRNTNNYVVGGKSTGYTELSGNIEKLTPMPDIIFNKLDGKIASMRKEASNGKSKSKPNKVFWGSKSKSNKVHDLDEADALVEHLEDFGFTNVEFRWDGSPYNFTCDQVGGKVACPCCGGVHDNNNFYYRVDEKELNVIVKNHSESCEAKALDSYKVVKYLFERKVCRLRQSLTYVVEEEKPWGNPFERPEGVRPEESINMYKYHGIRELFGHLKYTDSGPKPSTHKFMPTWLRDAHKRDYALMDFYPENCPDQVFNTWRGYAVEGIDPSLGAKGSEDMFVELVTVLTGDCPKYALDYYALLFQHPGRKPRTCLVYRGKPGCGKGMHLTSFDILMGSDLYFETNKAQQDVFGPHAQAFDCTKLVAMNESSMKYNITNKDTLLSLISDEKGVQINPKNINVYEVRNLAGTIMMSNDKVVVYVDQDDRRFVIFETNEKYRNDQVFFAAYEKYMLKPENQRAIYDFLMKRDISKVDWVKDRPRTKAYIEMVSSNLSPCLKWFAEFIDNYPFEFHDQNHGMRRRENIHKWKADDLCHKYPTQRDKDQRLVFGGDMREMIEDYEVPEYCLKKDKGNGVMWWTIDHQKSKKWLEVKGFLLLEEGGG